MDEDSLKIFERHIQSGRGEEALKYLRTQIRKDPSDWNLLYLAGFVARHLGDYDAAEGYYTAALQLNPTEPSIYLGAGIVQQQKQNYPSAIKYFRKAIQFDKYFVEAYNSLGLTLKKAGYYEDAISIYQILINLVTDRALKELRNLPGSTRFFNDTSHSNAATFDALKAEAYPALREILSRDLTYAIVQNNLGVCYAAMGKFGHAKASYEKAIAFTPDGIDYQPPYYGLKALQPSATETPVFNSFGEIAGSVSEQPDGRYMISADGNHDFGSALTSIFIAFSDMLSPTDRITFSKWAGLPFPEWTRQHRELFALAALHYIQQTDSTHQQVPDVVRSARRQLANHSLPPLSRSLTPEIANLFREHFEG